MSRASRSLLRLRDDRNALRSIRRAWPDLRLARHRTCWRARWWGSGVTTPIATGRTPAELGAAIRTAWIATGPQRATAEGRQ